MNKKIRKILACGLLGICIFNTSLKVHASDIMFFNSTVKDGLSQGTVQAMFQDSNGYVWLGTSDGLNRYNGYEYKKYYKGVNKEKSIINGYIAAINEDKNKNLWIGTVDGISRINLNDYSIKNYSVNDSNLPSNDISSIEIDSNGNIFIASSKGLSIYDEENDDFIILGEDELQYSKAAITSLRSGNDDMLYCIGDGIILKYDFKINKFTEICNEEINDEITDIYLDEDILWIGTDSKGLYKYNVNSNEIEDVKKYYKDENKDECYRIRSLFVDKDGNILTAIETGLVVYDTYGNVKNYTYNFYDKYTLVNDTIMSFMQDSSGYIWLGTYSGISIFKPNEGISYYCSTPESSSGLSGNLIHGVYEDSDGKLWIGSYGNGITIFDRNNDTYEYMTTDTENKLSSNVIADIKGNDKNIFVATDTGLNIIDKETKKVTVISDELNNSFCNNLYLDEDSIWVGTQKGVNIISLHDYSIKSLNDLFESLEVEHYLTNTIFKDSDGVFWIGLLFNGGLIKYNPNTGENKIFKNDSSQNSISDNSIACINEDSEGSLWIGTMNGLNKLNKESEEFTVYSTENGLSNNTIYSVLFDDNKKVWISTNSGVDCLEIGENDSVVVKQYVEDNEFNSNAHLKTVNEEIIFGGIDGLFIIDPYKLEADNYKYELKYDNFKVNGIETYSLEDVSIEYKNTSISIKLFTTMYGDIQGTKFFYKMSDEWIALEGNEITFSNLSPGKYDIEFKALNSNGEYSDTKSISFKVKPPFWSGNSAKVIYISLITSIIIYIYKKMRHMDETIEYKDNQLGKEMQEKNELLVKVLELEKRKNNYLVNISHELRTPLNVVSSIQQLVIKLNEENKISKAELKRYMDMSLQNVNRLLKLINDLMDSSKIDDGNYKLFLEEKNIVYIVEEAALSLKNLVEEKGINLVFDTEIEECIMKFDVDAIERCIINIVNNAVKFTDNGGEILVYISESKDVVKIDIKDSGCGIPEDKLEAIFDRFNQGANSKKEASCGSGLGLTITKRLIELHNGHIYVDSEINEGSTFTILLPKVMQE